MSIKDIRKRIPNADLFRETTNAAFQAAQANHTPLSAIVFDLDNLGPLNETYGQAAGDEVLDKLVSLIIEQLPSNGHLGVEHSWLERKGGDEFCAILEGGTKETAQQIAENVNKKLSTTSFSHVGIDKKITVTAGIADLKSGARNAGELIHFAETALYDAKRTGRGLSQIYHT